MDDILTENRAKRLESLTNAINEIEKKIQNVSKMNKTEKVNIALELLEAIDTGVDLASEPLQKMAVRRFNDIVECGGWTPKMLVRIKAICMISVRCHNINLLKGLLPVYQPILTAKLELQKNGLQDLTLLACLALKSGMPQIAEQAAKIILNVYSETRVAGENNNEKFEELDFLKLLKDILTTAARVKEKVIFLNVLRNITNSLLEKSELPTVVDMGSFYSAALFAAADKRWQEALPILKNLLGWMQKFKILKEAERQKLVYEWIQIIVQMARRNWSETAEQLLKLLLCFMSSIKNQRELLQYLRMLAVSMQMQVGRDSFANAFKIYFYWQLAMGVMINKAVKNYKRKPDNSQFLFEAILRMLQDMIIHVARLDVEKREADIFSEWYELWLNCQAPRHIKRRGQLVVQLTAKYWEKLQEDQCKTQIPHLIHIYQPSLIQEEHRVLLKG